MLTRLLLLVALLLGMVAPPSAGHAEHCGEATAPHHGTEGPVEQEHCPPVDCALATHCVTGAPLAAVVAPSLASAGDSTHLAGRTSRPFAGRIPEPPTPPPNRVV